MCIGRGNISPIDLTLIPVIIPADAFQMEITLRFIHQSLHEILPSWQDSSPDLIAGRVKWVHFFLKADAAVLCYNYPLPARIGLPDANNAPESTGGEGVRVKGTTLNTVY